jgi:hypothetical protein
VVLGLFLLGLLVIFENRKTPRFDACQKIAVRCTLDRNGCITSSYFNFAPDKTSRWQIVHRPGNAPGRVRYKSSVEGLKLYDLFVFNPTE